MTAARAALRRGWCPGALRPMETGDGWLVRLHPRGGRLSPSDLRRIADLARQHGNGLVDITARGNLQLRGIRPDTHRPLVEALLTAGLADPDEGDGPQRLVLASPLADRDPADHVDTEALAEAVEAAGADLVGLPAKTLVVVDGGGLSLDSVACDVRLRADTEGRIAIGLPDARWLGAVPPDEAPAAARALLGVLAAAHRGDPDAVRRLRDVASDPIDAAIATMGLVPAAPPAERPNTICVGIRRERNGTYAVLAAAPFGRLDARALEAIASLAVRHQAHDIRTTPWRGMALTGLADPAVVLADVSDIGLIIDPADPRLSVQACPGSPACSRGVAPAQADAAGLARAAAPRIARGLTLHVSGCAKGCAHSGRAGLTLVGQDGGYGLVLDGTASDTAHGRFAVDALARMLAGSGDIAAFPVRDPVPS